MPGDDTGKKKRLIFLGSRSKSHVKHFTAPHRYPPPGTRMPASTRNSEMLQMYSVL